MLHCTSVAVLRSALGWVTPSPGDGYDPEVIAVRLEVTPRFVTTFSQSLHASLTRAVAAMNNLVASNTSSGSQESFSSMKHIATILEDLATEMPHSVADLELAEIYWDDLRLRFDTDIKELEESLVPLCGGY